MKYFYNVVFIELTDYIFFWNLINLSPFVAYKHFNFQLRVGFIMNQENMIL